MLEILAYSSVDYCKKRALTQDCFNIQNYDFSHKVFMFLTRLQVKRGDYFEKKVYTSV